jgi:competence protein ComEC
VDQNRTGKNNFYSVFRKYPSVISVIPLAIGIIFSYTLRYNTFPFDNLVLIIIQAIIILVIFYVYTKINSTSSKAYVVFLLLVILLGWLRFQYVYNFTSNYDISRSIDVYENKNVILYGTLIEQPDINENRFRFILDADSIVSENKSFRVDGNLSASVYKNKYAESYPKRIEYGDKISIEGNLSLLPHRRNPGEFDYGEYLKLHGIEAEFTAFGYDKIGLTGKSDPNFFKKQIIYPVKSFSVHIIDTLVSGDEGEFLKGLVLGERNNISNEIKQNFVKAGVSHIIAVSGLNVAYVLIILNGILLLLPIKRQYKIFILILCLLFYMNLTGNVPSIIRATVMACVFLLSQLLERKPLSYNIIAFSAIIIMVVDPRQLFDAGFILSYGAILSIVIFYPKLVELLNNFKFYKSLNDSKLIYKFLRSSILLVLGTLAAQIGTLPITALMFKKISIISLITNLVAIPVSNIALAIGFIMVIASTFSIWFAGAFGASAAFLLHWLLWFIDYFANFDFSFFEIYMMDASVLVIYYVIIFLLFTIKKANYRPRLAITFLLILNFLVYKSYIDRRDDIRLTYLDVGNSSSCLISFPENKYNVLINAGTSTPKYTASERNVIPYLKSLGVDHLDQLMITSMSKDEFRNIIYLVHYFPVNKIVVPEYYKPLFFNNDYKSLFQNISIDYINSSVKFADGDNFRIYVFYLLQNIQSPSLLVKFMYDKEEFVFCDSRNLNEDYFYSRMTGATRVLKVPASGSFNYTSPEFIVRTNPSYVVISTSKNSKRLHSDIFSRSLEYEGIQVFKIAEQGAVIFKTDGYKTELVGWK